MSNISDALVLERGQDDLVKHRAIVALTRRTFSREMVGSVSVSEVSHGFRGAMGVLLGHGVLAFVLGRIFQALGCSGSPVYTARQRRWPDNTTLPSVIGLDAQAFLLGVWSASWKVTGSDIVSVKLDDDDPVHRLAPLGMGIVTPAPKLTEIIRSKELREASDRLLKR